MRFGRLIGAGQAGYVFQNMDNPKHYYKLVALPNRDLSEYPVRSLDRKLYAVNLMQAELFERLALSGNQPPSLPEVYSFVKGNTDPSLRRQLITSSQDFNWDDEIDDLLREFRTGQPYAIWEMEAIPCTDVNDYCEKYDGSKVSPLDNSDYQDLLRYLLSQGFVVRDIRNPENFGFRANGSQVFFDPIVAPWPVDNSNQQLLDAFTGTFGNDLVTVQRALDSGDYFNWYHGQAIMQSEEESTPEPFTTFAELQKLLGKGFDEHENLEQLIELESLDNQHPIGMDITKYPQYVLAMNWMENQEELYLQMKERCSKVLKLIWTNFVTYWDYEFSELWYDETGYRPYDAEPISPIFDIIQNDFTLQEVLFPMTTILFRIVNDPAAMKEMIDNDLAYDLVDLVYAEQELMRDLLLKTGKGNRLVANEACYKWVKKHTKRLPASDPDYKIHGRTKKRYLPEFNPPKSLTHYESLYDGRSRDEINSILRDGYDIEEFDMTWNIYLD